MTMITIRKVHEDYHIHQSPKIFLWDDGSKNAKEGYSYLMVEY